MATNSNKDLVLVTGASGFIASHVIKQLLEAGYKVRGTVRSLKNVAKVSAIRKLKPDANHSLELVEADLNEANSWKNAVKGCTYIVHVASPLPHEPSKTEEEVIRPAVDGTLSILKAAREAGTVKRVVLTSSNATINGGHPNRDEPFTENDSTILDGPGVIPYIKSKTLAERAARNYVASLPVDEKLEITFINPTVTLGPNLSGSLSASLEIPLKLLRRDMFLVPNIYFGICDVRDVATAHVKALTADGVVGQRHLINAGTYTLPEIAKFIEKEFKPQGYNIPTGVAPRILVYLAGFFDPNVKFILPYYGFTPKFDNSRMRNVLGITPRPVQDSIIDSCYSLIEAGFVQKTDKYKMRRE